MKKAMLDPEEKSILAAYDKGEFKPVKDMEAEIARLQRHARNTLKKSKRINTGSTTGGTPA
jgi:hypothetical protein